MEINVEGKKERKTIEELAGIIENHTNYTKVTYVNKYKVGEGDRTLWRWSTPNSLEKKAKKII